MSDREDETAGESAEDLAQLERLLAEQLGPSPGLRGWPDYLAEFTTRKKLNELLLQGAHERARGLVEGAELRRLIDELLTRQAATAASSPDDASLAAVPRPLLPKGVNSFTHGTIQKAVIAFSSGHTRNEVATKARLQPKDATRVRNLRASGLLSLNDRQKLVVDPRVGRFGSRIVLRYLDDLGKKYLDPYDNPPPLRRGGSG